MKKTKIILGTTILTASIVLAGCSSKSKEEKFTDSNSPFKLVKNRGYLSTDGSGFDVYEVEDKETGVHYYLLDGYEAVALSPIVKPDDNKKASTKDKELDAINNQIKELEKQKQSLENKED